MMSKGKAKKRFVRFFKLFGIYYGILLIAGTIFIPAIVYLKKDEWEREMKKVLEHYSDVPVQINDCFSKYEEVKKLPPEAEKLAVFIHYGTPIEIYRAGKDYFAIYKGKVFKSLLPQICELYFSSSKSKE